MCFPLQPKKKVYVIQVWIE